MNKATTVRKRFWIPTILFASTGFLAITAVPLYGVIYGYHWHQWIAFLIITFICGLAISAGNHRLWTHRAYEAHWILRLLLSLFSAATLQNTTLNWCSEHRRHHRYTDDNDRDPHSSARGFWHSHLDWMMHEYPSNKTDHGNVPDLKQDKIVMWQHKNYLPIALGMNFSICLLLGLITGDIIAMFLLAGVLRIVVNHHSAFALNSIGHYWGGKSYRSDISACDNPLINIFCFGEGYHNYHHAFHYDYRNGVRWHNYDPTKWLIKALSWLGATQKLKRAPDRKIEAALLEVEFEHTQKKLRKKDNDPSRIEILKKERKLFFNTTKKWREVDVKISTLNKVEPKPANEINSLNAQVKEFKLSLKAQKKRLRAMLKESDKQSSLSSKINTQENVT
ncbi:fatty acid desaturase [Microbulbifer sp. ANSA003]|uniref:fatty acid desaturase n=1 Tax=Microbulbifer sp. ANSA003 TaxID=3243360 RepID=UPI004042BFF3